MSYRGCNESLPCCQALNAKVNKVHLDIGESIGARGTATGAGTGRNGASQAFPGPECAYTTGCTTVMAQVAGSSETKCMRRCSPATCLCPVQLARLEPPPPQLRCFRHRLDTAHSDSSPNPSRIGDCVHVSAAQRPWHSRANTLDLHPNAGPQCQKGSVRRIEINGNAWPSWESKGWTLPSKGEANHQSCGRLVVVGCA